MQDLIESLQILSKYAEPEYPTNCEHEELFIDVNPELVSKEDKSRLEELGFNVSHEHEGFTSYKFGSC